MSDQARENVLDAIKASPIVTGFIVWLAGVSLENWVLFASLIYTLLIIGEKLWKLWKWLRRYPT